MNFTYRCCDCDKIIKEEGIIYLCPDCAKENSNTKYFRKGNLIVDLNVDYLKSLKNKNNLSPFDFFPYPAVDVDSFPVGPTPLVKAKNLNKQVGLENLIFKMESQLLSGSFKDRASQLVAFQAIEHNENRVTLASTGNAGAAMSCAGAAYNLNVILFVPESAPIGKLMQSILYGANVIPVKGSYDDAFELSLYYTKKFGGINRNTGYNPMTVEGKKSVSIELFLQLGKEMVDVIYVPVGDGCIYAGVCKGLFDLKAANLINKIPKVVCVQSKQSNAISLAFKSGTYKTVKPTTRADSISVGSPANGKMAVRYIHETESWTTEVDDKEILKSQFILAKEGALFVEPAAASVWAAIEKDKNYLIKTFGKAVSVCGLLTGSGLKDMDVFKDKVKMPTPINNNTEAVDTYFYES